MAIYIWEKIPITYTITWEEKSDMSSWWTYSDDAVWLTAWDTAFDTFFWYSAVLLDASWNEVEEVKQSSPWVLDMSSFQWALTWTVNNVMIKFPRRWIKMSKSDSQVTLSITDEPNKEWFQYYAFTKWTTAKDYLYLWAYKSTFSNDNSTVAQSFTSWTTYMKSWATWTKTLNFSPCANKTIANMRAPASKYGNWYSMITIYPRWYINCLYMMKYGNPNSQTIVWKGYTSWWSESIAPWWTNSQTNATYWTSSGTQQVKLFWLEDWWWNVNEFMDGCYFDASNNLTVDKTNNVFQSSAYDTNLWAASSWYMKTIDGSNDGMFRNTSASAWSSTTYYADYSLSYKSSVLCAGGYWARGNYAGAFHVSYAGTFDSSANTGARLQYL